MNEYTTAIPEFSTRRQRLVFESIRSLTEGTDYTLEFPTDATKGRIFFSLKSTRSYDNLMFGTVGIRGGVKLERFDFEYNKNTETGLSAWTWMRVLCRKV